MTLVLVHLILQISFQSEHFLIVFRSHAPKFKKVLALDQSRKHEADRSLYLRKSHRHNNLRRLLLTRSILVVPVQYTVPPIDVIIPIPTIVELRHLLTRTLEISPSLLQNLLLKLGLSRLACCEVLIDRGLIHDFISR